MQFLVIIDPPETLQPASDTSIPIMEELLAREHQVSICGIDDIWLKGAKPMAEALLVQQINRQKSPFLFSSPSESVPIEHFDAVLIRKDPPFDQRYLFATLMLEHARGRTFFLNDPKGLREANEKLYIFHFPEFIAPTIVSRKIEDLRSFLQNQGGHMIIKPLDGFAGHGIFSVRSDDQNAHGLLEMSTQGGKSWVMAQRYLPEVRQGDKRIHLLEGKPIGALLRVPPSSDVRSNLRLGGQAVKTTLTSREYEICEAIAPRLLEDGLHFVGIDVIGGYLTEVNVTSPTGIQTVNRLDHTRLERQIIDFLERSIENEFNL